MIEHVSTKCEGFVYGFNQALKLTLGKDLSNNHKFKNWKNRRLRKDEELNNLKIKVDSAETTADLKRAYQRAIAKARELQSLNCNYWNSLQRNSLTQIKELTK